MLRWKLSTDIIRLQPEAAGEFGLTPEMRASITAFQAGKIAKPEDEEARCAP